MAHNIYIYIFYFLFFLNILKIKNGHHHRLSLEKLRMLALLINIFSKIQKNAFLGWMDVDGWMDGYGWMDGWIWMDGHGWIWMNGYYQYYPSIQPSIHYIYFFFFFFFFARNTNDCTCPVSRAVCSDNAVSTLSGYDVPGSEGNANCAFAQWDRDGSWAQEATVRSAPRWQHNLCRRILGKGAAPSKRGRHPQCSAEYDKSN